MGSADRGTRDRRAGCDGLLLSECLVYVVVVVVLVVVH